MAKLIGQTIGQYQIIEQIGKGGMATVYKAYQPGLDRYVAFKILPEYYLHDETFLSRFQREARVIAKLSHPHILPIYDFGQVGNLTYIVMQYVDRGTLKDMMGKPMALSQAAYFIDQIADALDYAHRRGILHRDVKPSNILLEEGRRVLLTDFGLAKMVEGATQLTGSGVGVGTPAYMSPEQGQGLTVDARTDIYALGIILYEMVTGRVPYEAETPMAIVIKHINEPLPLPRSINPSLPEGVERLILKALAKNREERYASAGQMATALRQALATMHEEAGPTLPADRSTQASPTMPPPPAASTWPAPSPPLPAPSPSATWQVPSAPPSEPPPAATTWPEPPPQLHPSGPRPISPAAPPRTTSILPWILVGGVLVALVLLAGLAGLFFLTRNGAETPVPGVIELLPTPTFTLQPTNTPTSLPPTPGAPQFGQITFALGYDKNKLEPISPGPSFTEGVTEIHAVFEYNGMSNGDTWERAWYLDGQEVSRSSAQWNGDQSGVFDYFIDQGGRPLPTGNWRLELYVKGRLLSQGGFTIKGK
jgi:serine/threonine protein kinase